MESGETRPLRKVSETGGGKRGERPETGRGPAPVPYFGEIIKRHFRRPPMNLGTILYSWRFGELVGSDEFGNH